jgi:hypothetical protein
MASWGSVTGGGGGGGDFLADGTVAMTGTFQGGGQTMENVGKLLVNSTSDQGARVQIEGSAGAQFELRDGIANNTLKRGSVGILHYEIAEEQAAVIYGTSGAAQNAVSFGGGSVSMNTATHVKFYAAGDTKTPTGTEGVRHIVTGTRFESGVSGDPSDLFHVESAVGTALLIQDADNLVAVGHGSPSNQFHVIGTATTYVAQFHNDTASPGADGLLVRVDDNSASTDAFTVAYGAGYTRLFEVKAGGNVLVGSTVDLGAELQVVGSIEVRDNDTDDTLKRAFFTGSHQENDEEPVGAIYVVSNSPYNVVALGGGWSTVNAATQFMFYTASNYNTTNGTETIRVGANGLRLAKGVGGDPQDLLHIDCAGDGNGFRIDDVQGTSAFGAVPGTAAKVLIDQNDETGARPVLYLDQADVSEPMFKLVGESGAGIATQTFVDASEFTSFGNPLLWVKVAVEDVQASGPVADGDYYMPLYAVPTP